MDNNRRRKYPRGAIQEKTPLTAIDAIRAFYSWKGESLWVVVMQPPDTASEKTVTSHEVLVKPKEVLCRTLNRINTRTVDGKLPESVGFHDPCRPSFANPWRSYCQAMRNRLPPLMHFRPPVVAPMLFREPPQSLESLSQDIGRVRDQVASLVYWFLPELSRVLPCLRQDNSPARSDDDINTNVSPQWTISRKRVWFLRGEQSRLALTLEMDG